MAADLTAYVPRLLLEWEQRFGGALHRSVEGTLVFADVSGFTRLSEALARKGGKIGAEQLADVINALFGELLLLAAARGGEMLKYGGDAMLLFFAGEKHALRGAAASVDMQKRLREIGRVDTGGAGVVRLRMSVGAHAGAFDLFNAGRLHRELVVAGPSTSVTVAMEAEAGPTEILVSPALAAQLPSRNVGAEKAGGYLVRGQIHAPVAEPVPLDDGYDATRYLAEPLVVHLSSSTGEAEHRMATVSFLQFLELDRLLVAGRAAEAAQRVDDVLTLVQETYLRFGVTFLATDLAADGAKVMAAAGAPNARGDDEERMLRASRAILDAAPALPIRIGLQRGHVFAGDVGPTFRRTYTALGDVTNTAARVMGRAQPGQCLVLEAVLEGATSEWTAEPLEPFLAKGKTEPLVPWLVGKPGERRTRSSDVPLIGREAEMSRLSKELAASTSEVRTVDVVGEPGLGKSRLLAEIAAIARGEGRPVFTVRSDPFSSATAHRAIELLATAVTGPLDAAGLHASVSTHVPALVEELPLVGLALGLRLPATETTAHLDDSVLPQRIARASATFLDALLPEGAVVMVEDAHWVDEPSGAVIEALRATRNGKGLLLCVSRRAEVGGWAPQDVDALVALAPLAEEDALALIEMVSARPLLPDDARRLVAQAAGNPLFAEQLASAPAHADLPDSVEEVMAARIDQLPPGPRDLLRRLSVLGPSFDAELAAAVDGEVELESLGAFVSRDGTSFRFAHALLQQAAYAGLSYRRRRELHRRVASHVIDTGADEKRLEELSMHCDSGSMWDEARHYASAAARSAEAGYAFAIAAVHWQRAAQAARLTANAEAAEIADLWYACGEAHRRAGKLSDAQQAYRMGRKVAPAGSAQRVVLATAVGRTLLTAGQGRRAGEWARKARNEARLSGPFSFAVEASVEELRADIAEQSDPQTELVLGRSLAERAHRHGDLRLQARAQSHVYLAASHLGLPEQEAEGAKARELAEQVGDVRLQVSVLANLGEAAESAADWSRAMDLFASASKEAGRAGFTLGQAIIDNNAAEILVNQGRLDEAMALLIRARTTADAAGHWHGAYMQANVGWVHGLQGRADLSRRCLDEAYNRLESLSLSVVLPEVDRRRVIVALVHGQAGSAHSLLDSSLRSVEPNDPILSAWRSHAHRQLLQLDEAQQAAERAGAAAEASGNDYGRLVAAEALWRLGDTEQASLLTELGQRLGIVARPVIP